MDQVAEFQPVPEQVALRLFVVDEKTRDPMSGVLVRVAADPSAARAAGGAAQALQPLAELQTDQAGYVSFKLDPDAVAGASTLFVAYGDAPAPALRVDVAALLAGADTYTLQAGALAEGVRVQHLGLPAVMEADARDFLLSPGSVGHVPQLMPHGGLCGQLMPTTMSVRRYPAFQVRANVCDGLQSMCNSKFDLVAEGELLEYEVAWHPAGSALGELLNTISLAPCEQVNVAVADWMRRETAVREESSLARQQVDQQTDHDRLLNESMSSAVTGRSRSWGVSAGGSRSAGISAPLKKLTARLDLTAAFAGGISGSSDSQTVAASTTSALSERIRQSASWVASRHSTVVFQTTATEHRAYQTRTIRNHNVCHTLNLQFYQINRNYRVVTRYRGRRRVVLVQYANVDFDAHRAYCHAAVLREALLDPALDECFDALGDALFCCGGEEGGGGDVRVSTITVTIRPAGIVRPGSIHLFLHTPGGSVAAVPIHTTGWQAGGTYTQTVTLSAAVDPRQVTQLVAHLHGSGWFGLSSLAVQEITITCQVPGYAAPVVLHSSTAPGFLRTGWSAPVNAQLPEPEDENPCVRASCCVRKLLAHLNCHKRHYNSVVWMNEDPDDRVMRWRCCRKEGWPAYFPQMVENTPVTVYGDFVVFPAGPLVPEWAPTVTKLVTMPTPGVYAEAILGQCGACETLDGDQYWSWKDAPCKDTAPSIKDLPGGGATVDPGDLKADAISNVITLSTVPAAGDGALKSLISALVADADKGSTAAQALLGKLLDAVKAGLAGGTEETAK